MPDRHFKTITLGSVLQDKLGKVETATLQSMLEQARLRVASYVEIRVRPATAPALRAVVQDALIFKQCAGAPQRRILWSYDCKCATEVTGKHVYKVLPQLDEKDFQMCMEALLGETGVDARSDSSLFRFAEEDALDLLLLFDGRRAATSGKLSTYLRKALRGESRHFPCPNVTAPIRLMHRDEPLRGNLQMRRAGKDAVHHVLPEPLETMHLVYCRSFRLPVKDRAFLDLPGTNRTRGLNNIPPRVPPEQSGGVAAGAKKAILGLPAGSGLEADAGGVDDMFLTGDEGAGNKQAASADQDAGNEQATDSGEEDGAGPCPLFCWEQSELLWRELINMYRPRGSIGGLVDFTAGSGIAALAAARDKVLYLGFARTAAHKEAIMELLHAQIVGEMIDGKSDGFLARRFLSRQRSLTGGHSGDPKSDRISGAAPATVSVAPPSGASAACAARSEAAAGAEVRAGSRVAEDAPSEEDESSSEEEEDT